MGQRKYKKHQAKPDQKKDKLALNRLKAEGMPQAAIQRFADGSQTPEDILVLQKTLGNGAVAGLLSQGHRAPGLESGPVPTVQRQDPMEEEEPMAAVDGPEEKEESGGLWGGLKKAWGWFKENVLGGGKSKTDQTTTPKSGTPPEYTPQEGIEEEHEDEAGEWTEEIMY